MLLATAQAQAVMQYETYTYTSNVREITYWAVRNEGFVRARWLGGGGAFYWVRARGDEEALALALKWAEERFPPTPA